MVAVLYQTCAYWTTPLHSVSRWHSLTSFQPVSCAHTTHTHSLSLSLCLSVYMHSLLLLYFSYANLLAKDWRYSFQHLESLQQKSRDEVFVFNVREDSPVANLVNPTITSSCHSPPESKEEMDNKSYRSGVLAQNGRGPRVRRQRSKEWREYPSSSENEDEQMHRPYTVDGHYLDSEIRKFASGK